MDSGAEPESFSALLKRSTHDLHVAAERSGFIADMLQGRAGVPDYVLYLRNLLPAYQQLELGLVRLRDTPLLADFALEPLYRAPALAADLDTLWGPTWEADLPILSAAQSYADGIARAAGGRGEQLIGHAYVRYLGDLNGGQVLKRLLSRSLDLPPERLSFYDFPAIDDLPAFKQAYRDALDRSGGRLANREAVIDAARWAFARNIEVSMAVAARPRSDGRPRETRRA